MRWIVAVVIAVLATSGMAHAQSTSGAICAPYQESWSKASAGGNIAAMDRVLATIPAFCSDLKSRAQEYRNQIAATAKSAAPTPAAKARSARSEPELKQAFQALDWICAKVTPAGFDLEAAYDSFPLEKLTIKPEERTPNSDGKYLRITRIASGQAYAVEYHFQTNAEGQDGFGYSIAIDSRDMMAPLFPKPALQRRFLGAFGPVSDGVIGPLVGFGPKNDVVNRYPLSLQVWTTGRIYLEWFSPRGLGQIGALCKK